MPTSIHGTNGITFNDGSTQTTRPAVGFRNRIINGDMRIWQRGTTISNPISSTNFYTADRWGCNRSGDVTGAVVSRIASGLTGFEYALALQRVAGDTNTGGLSLWYSNESTNTYDLTGNQVTLSFWAKAGSTLSSAGSQMYVAIVSGTGTDQRIYNYTGGVAFSVTYQTITTSWVRYSFTGTVPSNSTELGLQINFAPSGTAGADDSIKITGVQLEAGSTATEFERRPIGTEMMLCQRYYDKSYSADVAPYTVTKDGLLLFSTESYAGGWYMGGASIRFSTEMRRVPDFTYIDSAGTASRVNAFYNGSTNAGANPPFTVYTSKKSVAISQTGIAVGGSSGSPLLAHYTANAEL
jgi:hypothetical protein